MTATQMDGKKIALEVLSDQGVEFVGVDAPAAPEPSAFNGIAKQDLQNHPWILPRLIGNSGLDESDPRLVWTDNRNVREKTLMGMDDRKVLEDCSETPLKAIGLVRVLTDRGDAIAHFTGVLVAPNLVLTSAAAMVRRRTGALVRTVFIPGFDYLGYDKEKAPFGEYKVAKALALTYPEATARELSCVGTDFAVLVLDRPVGKNVGTMEVRPFHPASSDGYWAHIGFPIDYAHRPTFQGNISVKAAESGSRVSLKDPSGKYASVEGLALHTDCDHNQGQQGGPLFNFDGEKTYVVGVLHGNDMDNANATGKAPSPVFSSGPSLLRLVRLAAEKFGN